MLFELADCVGLLQTMPLFHDRFTVFVLFIQAIFTGLMGKLLLLNLIFEDTISLKEFFFTQLIAAKL